jgi:ABC-type transporter Mla subunit MlaD
MNTTTRYFKLGLFILVSVGVLVGGAILLGAGTLFSKSITLQTCFDESIAGLDVGAPVKYRGVTIGHVQSIRFPHIPPGAVITSDPSGPFKNILVDMAIDSQVVAGLSESQLKQVIDEMVAGGLRARISQSGITGSAYIEVNYLDPARNPIKAAPPASVRGDAPYVPSAPGQLSQVVDAVQDIVTKLQRADLDKVVKHVDALILHADQSVQDLQVAELRTRTAAILDRLQGASTRLQQILDDPKLAQVISDLPEITGRVRSVAAQADDLLKNGKFDETATHLRQTLAQADELLAAQSDNVRVIMTDLRATMANARQMSEEVKSNPSRLLFGQPPPRAAYGGSK